MGGLLIPILAVILALVVVVRYFKSAGSNGDSKLPELIGRLKYIGLVSRSKLAGWDPKRVILRLASACSFALCPGRILQRARGIGSGERWQGGLRTQLISRLKFPALRRANSNRSAKYAGRGGLPALDCRVHLTKQKKDNRVFDAFSVEICGAIPAPSDMHYATVEVSIVDITDGLMEAKPVRARVKQWQTEDSSLFCYSADLGKLPYKVTRLSDWTSVAKLHLDWLRFARKGRRDLQFNTSILSRDSGEELACVKCTFAYENPDFGYMDLEENIQRTKTCAVALAFAVSAADNKLYDCEVELIKNWARANIDVAQTSEKAWRKLEKALNETIAFFRDGHQLDAYEICKEVVEIAPLAERYDILELCLYVAQATGFVAAEELAILKNLARWLEVDTGRFREMMEKILPVSMYEVKDPKVVLGVTSDMSGEKTREYLNKEYIKWNSRVTNSDPEVQTQADQMLKLIAEARRQFVEGDSISQKDGDMATP